MFPQALLDEDLIAAEFTEGLLAHAKASRHG